MKFKIRIIIVLTLLLGFNNLIAPIFVKWEIYNDYVFIDHSYFEKLREFATLTIIMFPILSIPITFLSLYLRDIKIKKNFLTEFCFANIILNCILFIFFIYYFTSEYFQLPSEL